MKQLQIHHNFVKKNKNKTKLSNAWPRLHVLFCFVSVCVRVCVCVCVC